MPEAKTKTFLVFESSPQTVRRHVGQDQFGAPMFEDQPVNEAIPFICVASVRCAPVGDMTAEQIAVQTVMRSTRRIGRYAVVEAAMIDFTVNDAEGDNRPQLNA